MPVATLVALSLLTGAMNRGLYPVGERPDLLIADFESEDYGPWQVEGTAFGPGPARGTLPGQMPVSGYRGKRLVNSFYGGDRSTGRLVSPSFVIQRRFIHFLIGGGGYRGKTCINLIVDGRVVRTATGPNTRPGGSERLNWHTWDVSEFEGKEARIEILDRATGGWGHINVDHIVQSDRPAVRALRREIKATRRYLNLPVQRDVPRRRMRVLADGRVAREFDIRLAEDTVDYWVFMDLRPFRGQQVIIEMPAVDADIDLKGFGLIHQADRLVDEDTLYRERYRPQFRFTTRRGWNNDPNGLVYHRGVYHLFYQHNPYGTRWGNMHWGYAVSKDLVHWRELGIALYPRRYGDWCFSGSAVVDHQNTSGWGSADNPPLVVAYTSTGRGECIAYSLDGGRTFREYEGNPVVRHRGRDPRLVWYAPGRHWVMAVYDEFQGKRWIAFYRSRDLKHWRFSSRIEGFYECPELFELPVEGSSGERRWIAYGADGAYVIGHFDGERFRVEVPKQRYNFGNCFYASQTFSNVPDGRRVQIAWGRMNFPGMPFNQMMTFPVELTLRRVEGQLRLCARPVREIERLHAESTTVQAVKLRPGAGYRVRAPGRLWHITARFHPGDATEVGLMVRGVSVTVDVRKRQLHCHGNVAPLPETDGAIQMELLVDRGSIEIFAQDGAVYMPVGVLVADGPPVLEAYATGGRARLERLTVWRVKSIWSDQP